MTINKAQGQSINVIGVNLVAFHMDNYIWRASELYEK